jgi:hypothetical protein
VAGTAEGIAFGAAGTALGIAQGAARQVAADEKTEHAVNEAMQAINNCSNKPGGAAYPATGVIDGNGGSWFQIYRDVVNGDVYVSWSLKANTLANGADTWGFGLQVTTEGSSQNTYYGYIAAGGTNAGQFGICQFVAHTKPSESLQYWVDAGAGGWTSNADCTLTVDWHVTVGLEVLAPTATTTFGGSLSCGAGVTWDSESLLRGTGIIGFMCIEDVDC